ncbi:MAG: Zn-dependent hydrolase [Alicyclobacillus sp.]|nr:Zn-dependent hydrolase [Alicyclobacillus sp.]
MKMDGERLWSRLSELHAFGATADGGVTRFAWSDAERQAKDRVAVWMREAGLEVREDAAGNLIGRWSGREPEAPVLLVGSHLDSVPNGGDFDGPLGVLSAIEAVDALRRAGRQPRHPVEVIAFTDEEGARFRYGMTGSRAVAGTLRREELDAHTDADGTTIAAAMTAYGLEPDRIGEAARAPGSVLAYLELHIEQGQVLEAAGQPVGVVSGIAGPLWLKFTVVGRAGHAGTTPMPGRRDALVAAAEMVQMMSEEAAAEARTVATVGQLSVRRGGVNIIPGQVEFTLDLRDVDEAVRDRVEQRIRARVAEICEARGVSCQVEELQRVPPVQCNEALQAAIVEAGRELGLSLPTVVSGAGHDGMQCAGRWPIAMLFARSRAGISHHPDEYTSPEDCALAAEILARTVARVAGA